MPSREHDILVELFRNRPQLAAELLAACTEVKLPVGIAVLGSVDISQVAPTEYRADVVVVIDAPDGTALAAVIVEVQLHVDRDKCRAWPAYLANQRARLDCPVVLLVIAPELGVARWARQPIETGHPGFRLVPIVLSYPEVPRVVDLEAARRAPELAVLSALAHAELDVATATANAVTRLPENLAKLYLDIVLTALPAELRRGLEDRMIENYEYQSDFARRYLAQGREEARREDVVRLAQLRLGSLAAEDEARIRAAGAVELAELFDALGGARDEVDARAAFARWRTG
jgi:hypothetical protein